MHVFTFLSIHIRMHYGTKYPERGGRKASLKCSYYHHSFGGVTLTFFLGKEIIISLI